jgi:hypothetical protein
MEPMDLGSCPALQRCARGLFRAWSDGEAAPPPILDLFAFPGYRPPMPDPADKLTPADPRDLGGKPNGVSAG